MKRVLFIFCIVSIIFFVEAVRPKKITIDGNFDDWNDVTKYYDPDDAPDGSVVQDGIPDVHGTNEHSACGKPPHVINDDVNILEFAFAHDDNENFYAYINAKGNISRTSVEDPADNTTSAGRSYIQVVIDVDDNLNTGYCINEGGYFPTGCGYDMHFELEMYNGTFNTAHYLLHAMNDTLTYNTSYELQKQGLIDMYLLNGSYLASYHPYTEWVMFDAEGKDSMTDEEVENCAMHGEGPWTTDTGDVICFVEDEIEFPFKGIMEFAFSEDGHSVEMKAPWRGFMRDMNLKPIIQYGNMIHVAFSLEVSGQYSTPIDTWATDSTRPIRGYIIEEPKDKSTVTIAIWVLALTVGGCVLVGGLIMLGAMLIYKKHYMEQTLQAAVARTKGYDSIDHPTPKGSHRE